MARMVLSPYATPTPVPNWPPMPQTMTPNTPPPRYTNQTPTSCTLPQSQNNLNKPAPDDNLCASPTNPFQATPSTNQGLFPSPATGVTATPQVKTRNGKNDLFTNWDRCNPCYESSLRYPMQRWGLVGFQMQWGVWTMASACVLCWPSVVVQVFRIYSGICTSHGLQESHRKVIESVSVVGRFPVKGEVE